MTRRICRSAWPIALLFVGGIFFSANASEMLVGDQTGDGTVSVSDVQMLILLALDVPLPLSVDANENDIPDACEAALQARFAESYSSGWQQSSECLLESTPTAPMWTCADLNGDDETNVGDVVLAVQLALALPLADTVDSDSDGVPDGWQAQQLQRTKAAQEAGVADALAFSSGCDSGCAQGQVCCGGTCEATAANPCGSAPCDDGIACTVDYCDPNAGCAPWPDFRLCPEGQVCDSELGCVPGSVWSVCGSEELGAPTGFLCGVGPPEPGAVWSPPAIGDVVECEFRLAAADLSCADDWLGCFVNHMRIRFGWSTTLVLSELYADICEQSICEEWILPFSTPEQANWDAPNGFRFRILEAESQSDWTPGGSERISVRPPLKPFHYSAGMTPGPAVHAFLAGDEIIGEPTVLRARFEVVEELSQRADAALCVGELNVTGYQPVATWDEDWPPTQIELREDGVLITSPSQGWVCNDFELCTTDSWVPGIGCLLDPLTEEECDDGIWCTWDVCDNWTGECKHSGKSGNTQCPELGDLCILDSPFADPSTGCVHDMWSHICWAGEDFCTLGEMTHWDGASGPPEGEYLICPIRLARSQETCENPQEAWCIPSYGDIRLGFDPSLLQLVGGYDTVCYEGFGCFVLPWFDESGQYALDTGHPYLGSTDLALIGDLGWHILTFLTFTTTGVLTTAYLDETGNVAGNATVVDIWFRFDDGVNQSLPTTVCADSVDFGNRYLAHFADELAGDGLIILYPPE